MGKKKIKGKILFFTWLPAIFVTLFCLITSFQRFITCSNSNFDLAFYTRIVWGYAFSDRCNSLIGAHDIGLHLSPVLYFFVPFAYFFSIPVVLLASQALALGISTMIFLKIASRKIGDSYGVISFTIAFILWPAILKTGSEEFHPSVLSLPFLLLGFNEIDRGKIAKGLLLLIPAIFCREDSALVAGSAGLWAIIWGKKDKILAIIFTLFIFTYFCAYMFLIQPTFLPPHGSFEEHFPGLGRGIWEIFQNIAGSPVNSIIKIISLDKFLYLFYILISVAFLPLLSPSWLLAVSSPLFINFLSMFPDSSRLESHYSILIAPGLFLSSLGGFEKLTRWVKKQNWITGKIYLPKFIVLIVVITGIVVHYFFGALPGSKKFNLKEYTFGRNNGILCWYSREIKDKKEISALAPYGALAHLADRRRIYSIDFTHPKPDVAILDISQRRWLYLDISRWFEPWEMEYERLIADPEYGLWKSNPPYEILWRGKSGGKERVSSISMQTLPQKVKIQNIRWEGAISLEAIDASLRIINEEFTGNYEKLIVVKITFYWRALTRLPDDLFVKAKLSGRGKTIYNYFRPTWGIRKTGTWKRNEIIRDEETFVSPGGWPLREISAEVMFVTPQGLPYPDNAKMKKLAWPEWEADLDRHK